MLRPYVAGVLEGTAWLDENICLETNGPWSRRWPAVAGWLRRGQIDLAVLFPNSFRSALVAWLGKCRRRIGYRRFARDVLLTDRLTPVRGPDGRLMPSPIIDAYNRLAECAGCPWPGYRLELATTPRDDEAADAVWRHERLDRCSEVICLNPGAAFGSAKHWPAESFARLAQEIADRRGSGILVLCGPGEEALARRIVTHAGRHGVVSLAGRPLSLGLTKACIRRSDLLITTDSGPRHFAAAFDRPVVTLFGPTHIAWTETYFYKAIHLQKKVACGPCQLRACPLDHRCMNLLTPHEVFTAAADLLTRCRGTRSDVSRRVG